MSPVVRGTGCVPSRRSESPWTHSGPSASVRFMIYQHPLAYLLGLEGVALRRSWMGDYDREFVTARIDEVRRLLANESLASHPGVVVDRGDTRTGYRQMSSRYDDGSNDLFDYDEPVVYEITDALPAGDALDAACGTGRFAAHLAARRHRVVGVDSSPEMLDLARARVSGATFVVGDLHRLPLPDNSVDLVVCGLALTHVAELGPVFAEWARVLRPGGHLVVSDVHQELVLLGSVIPAVGPHGEPGLAPTYRHSTGDFLRAALPAGFAVRRCEEEPRPGRSRPDPEPATPEADAGTWQDWPWSLMAMVPAAALAATGRVILVLHFQLAAA